MRPYEVMTILHPGLEDEAIQATVSRVTELLTAKGGRVHNVDHWGKRRLAYEVDHHSEGYYLLVEATAEPAVMAELDRMLSLTDEVIRHKTIRIPDVVAGRGQHAPAE